MQTLIQQPDEELCTILQSSAHFPDLADTMHMHLVCTMPDDELIAHLRKKYPLEPDIMIKVAANKSAQPGKSLKQRGRILLVEIGYCREGFARSKMAEKQKQHRLARYLMQQMGHDVKYCTVTLGVTGAQYSDLEEMINTLQTLIFQFKGKLEHSLPWMCGISQMVQWALRQCAVVLCAVRKACAR